MVYPPPRRNLKLTPSASRNPVLRALLDGAPAPLLRELEPVVVETGEIVHDNRLRAEHVWMPFSCILSSRVALPDGASMEAALHGEEGFVGIWSTLGIHARGEPRPDGSFIELSVVALRGGLAWRMPVDMFRAAWQSSAALQVAMLALQSELGTETLVRAICNRHHRIDRQLCRWLMLYHDRARSDELIATHQDLADILGVRREGITEALGELAHSGAVELRRGGLRIRDAARVVAGACRCYRPGSAPRFSATKSRPTAMNTTDNPMALRKATP